MTRQQDNSRNRFFDALEPRMLMSAVDGASNSLMVGQTDAPTHDAVEEIAMIAEVGRDDTSANVPPDAAPGDWGAIVFREDSDFDFGFGHNNGDLHDANNGVGDLTDKPSDSVFAFKTGHKMRLTLMGSSDEPAAGVVSPSTLITARQILKNNTTAQNGGTSSSAVQVLGTTFNDTVVL